MNGKKKIEVRSGTRLYNAINRLIKEQGKAPCLIYCTMGKETLAINPYGGYSLIPNKYHNEYFSGKVVAEFEASAENILSVDGCFYETDTLSANTLLARSCLREADLDKYLGGKDGTAIHIDNLKIFDKPKELKDYGVKYSPQSYCYCEVNE